MLMSLLLATIIETARRYHQMQMQQQLLKQPILSDKGVHESRFPTGKQKKRKENYNNIN